MQVTRPQTLAAVLTLAVAAGFLMLNLAPGSQLDRSGFPVGFTENFTALAPGAVPAQRLETTCGEAERLGEDTPFLAFDPERPVAADEPPEGTVTVVVDLESLRLTLEVDGEAFRDYPIAIGRWTTPTPVGEFTVADKAYAPGGPFGAAWLGLNVPWGSYGIHGTNQPGSIGSWASAGCIRMFNSDVLDLYEWVPLKTVVRIKGALPEVSVRRSLEVGASGQDVQNVQYRLRQAGFDPGLLDGHFGEQMESAVRNLQRYYDLEVTGTVGSDELHVLGLR